MVTSVSLAAILGSDVIIALLHKVGVQVNQVRICVAVRVHQANEVHRSVVLTPGNSDLLLELKDSFEAL